jgi:hypothetical protein
MTRPDPELAPLEPFIGAWDVRALFPGTEPDGVPGRATFEWILGGRFVLQRATMNHPDFPEILGVIGADGDGFVQHYFDSRGVVRLYAMTLDGGQWTLWREAPDFGPGVEQRYVGAFEDGGRTIRGRWENGSDAANWELDFEMIYTRAGVT